MLFLRWRRSHPFRHVRSTILKIRGTLCVFISIFFSQLHQIYLHVRLRFSIQNKSQNILSELRVVFFNATTFTYRHTCTLHYTYMYIARTDSWNATTLLYLATHCTALHFAYSEFRNNESRLYVYHTCTCTCKCMHMHMFTSTGTGSHAPRINRA